MPEYYGGGRLTDTLTENLVLIGIDEFDDETEILQLLGKRNGKIRLLRKKADGRIRLLGKRNGQDRSNCWWNPKEIKE